MDLIGHIAVKAKKWHIWKKYISQMKIKQGRKVFQSTCASCTVIQDMSRWLDFYERNSNSDTSHSWSRTLQTVVTRPSTNVAHCCLTSVMRCTLVTLIHESLVTKKIQQKKWKRVVSRSVSLTRAPTKKL